MLGLKFIPPELREDRGEIEAAMKGALPRLVDAGRIKGDLHVHSDWSDGAHSIKEIAGRSREMGYEYVAVTDHSKRLKVAGGLSERDVLRRLDEIRRLNASLKGIRVLAGTEVDILPDGSLDYDKDLLRRFDLVVAAVHSAFRQPKERFTDRLVRALETGLVHILAHPTCRLMGTRDACELDLGRVLKAAKATGAALEINSFPERMDLDDVNAAAAREAGVKLAIGTDAHTLGQLESMRLGVSVARRAWLEEKDLVNTMPLKGLLSIWKR